MKTSTATVLVALVSSFALAIDGRNSGLRNLAREDSADEVLVASPSELDRTESRIKMAGREARRQERQKLDDQVKAGKELEQKSESKRSLQLETAKREVARENRANGENVVIYRGSKANLSTRRQIEYEDQNLRDLRRVANGNSEDALNNFLDRKNRRPSKDVKEQKKGIMHMEREAKKEEAYQLKWDPVGAGKREDKHKASVKFLRSTVRENQQKKRWGLPHLRRVDLGMLEAEVRPPSRTGTPANDSDMTDWAQKSRDAYAAARELRVRAYKSRLKAHKAGGPHPGLHPDGHTHRDRHSRARQLRIQRLKRVAAARAQAHRWMQKSMREDAQHNHREAAFKHRVYLYMTAEPDEKKQVTEEIRMSDRDPAFEDSVVKNDVSFLKKLEMEERLDDPESSNSYGEYDPDPDITP